MDEDVHSCGVLKGASTSFAQMNLLITIEEEGHTSDIPRRWISGGLQCRVLWAAAVQVLKDVVGRHGAKRIEYA